MSLISLNALEESGVGTSAVELKVEFDVRGVSAENRPVEPIRISAQARDLTEWDAASTCPSDDESVILFDSSVTQTCFVVGSSVIFRNLKPNVSGVEIDRAVESLGMTVGANCPTFKVARAGMDAIDEFNFGFATIPLSGPEEATMLNFLLHSHGLDQQLTSGLTDDSFGKMDVDERIAVRGLLDDLQQASVVH